MSGYLPQEMIIQILHKLPIKALVRCTCVCKFWHSLIRNPSFISTHLTQTLSSNTHLLLFRLCSKGSEHYSLHFDNKQQLSPYMILDFPFKSYNPYFCVKSSVNGIICLVDNLEKRTNTFILWNPLIKKSITLPNPSVTFMYPVYYKEIIGFGFDSKTNDYKVLRIVCGLFDEENEESEDFMEVDLYSLNTSSWKRLTCVAPKYEFDEERQMQQPFVNGVVHWMAFQDLGGWECRNVVLGFDMGDEVFCEIKLPETLADVLPSCLSVKKYGDSSIAVVEKYFIHPFECHIWVMMEYGVVESWTKLASISEQGGEQMPTVLGFRKGGEVLVQLEPSDKKIFSCDPQNNGVMDLGLGNDQSWIAFIDGYVESLILLDNANAANNVTEDESNESMGATDDSSDAINDTSDDGSDAASDNEQVMLKLTCLWNREPATRSGTDAADTATEAETSSARHRNRRTPNWSRDYIMAIESA